MINNYGAMHLMPHNATVEIVEETENGDGTWSLTFDVNDDFKGWFKKQTGRKRWSDRHFHKAMNWALARVIEEESRNKKAPLDLAIEGCESEYEEEIDLYKTYGGD
jgi:hypothetical protein